MVEIWQFHTARCRSGLRTGDSEQVFRGRPTETEVANKPDAGFDLSGSPD
jgi:hypothetical protein